MEKNTPKSNRLNAGRVIKTVFSSLGRFFATLIMVGIITGCIVACVLTVYIMSYLGSEDVINLDDVQLGYTSSMLYLNKETNQYEELQKLYLSDNNRIWVDYNNISDYVKNAVVAIEDKRFHQHQGVDWWRTSGAFISQFVPGAAVGGGSTITQQLVKNVTQDKEYRVERKVREIFRALELEKKYSKERILEAYLNVVPFGAGTNGIETAALTYFGKHAKDLDLAEAACIVGITKYPGYYSPFRNPENNKERQEYVLQLMYEEQGSITEAQYKQALAEKLNFKRTEYELQDNDMMSYFEDHVFNTVLKDLQEQKGWTYSYARDKLYKSGYKIYTTVDLDIQKYLEDFYKDTSKFPTVTNSEYPQSCVTILDPTGKLLAVVGKIGEKEGSLAFNRATMATRQPGSSIKPLATYAPAIEYNRVNWSSIIADSPISLNGKDWPTNYYNSYRGNVTVAYAIQQSVNTIPVKLQQNMGPETAFEFLRDRLNFYSLIDSAVIDGGRVSDISLAPMAIGALTKGVTPLEMAGGYQIFNNGGKFTTPYSYTKVEDANGRTILEVDTAQRQVISEDTSVLMNKLLQTVNTAGTGTTARLSNMPTAGKTGTSDDDVNQWYIGMTPYYIGQVWLGYDNETYVNEYGTVLPNSIRYSGVPYPPPVLWKSIMEPLHEGLEAKPFPESEGVVSRQFCTITGLLATDQCPTTGTGWYKASHLPSSCPGHPTVPPEGQEGDGAESDATGTDPAKTTPIYVRDEN